MSHIGDKTILIPNGVNINIQNNFLVFNGKFGSESILIPESLDVIYLDNKITINKLNDLRKTHCYQGLYRSLINNIILGISIKFKKILYINGVGYKFKIENNILEINSGFSHVTKLSIPNYLELILESATKLIISGINKEKVGLFASKIRQVSPPEPYKGKGIHYENEKIRRKIGKTGK
jgi:large subunit ribosomal protein L6